MLAATYFGVPVIFRSTWDSEEDAARKRAKGDRPISWSDGTLVENVKVMDPTSGEVADWTIAQHLNGELVVGGTYDLDVETTIKKEGNRTKYSHRIVAARQAASGKDLKAADLKAA